MSIPACKLTLYLLCLIMRMIVVFLCLRPKRGTLEAIASIFTYLWVLEVIAEYLFGISEPWTTLIQDCFSVIMFFVVSSMFEGRFLGKFFIYSSAWMFSDVLLLICRFIAGMFQGVSQQRTYEINFGIAIFFTVLFYIAVRYALRKIILRLYISLGDDIPIWMAFYPCIVMGVFIVAMSSIRLESYNVSALNIAFFIMCLLVYILFIQTSLQISERKHAEQEVIFSRQIVEQQRLHYSKLLEGMQSARLMRHDFALHTRALLGMKDKSSMDDYLRHMVSEYSVPSPGQFCENEAVNMIISHYHLECQKQNIAFDAHTQIASELPIDDMSLCVVIGNLMENALEACSYLDDGRYINLNSRWVDSSQIIMVENSFDGYVRKNEGNMLSRKKNGGLGLSSIRRIASHPGDEVHIHHTGDTFTVIVSLMERG